MSALMPAPAFPVSESISCKICTIVPEASQGKGHVFRPDGFRLVHRGLLLRESRFIAVRHQAAGIHAMQHRFMQHSFPLWWRLVIAAPALHRSHDLITEKMIQI